MKTRHMRSGHVRTLLPLLQVLLLAGLLPLRPPLAAAQSVQIERGTLNSAGAVSSSGSYALLSALGETVSPGRMEGGSFSVDTGLLQGESADPNAPSVTHAPPDPQSENEPVVVEARVESIVGIRYAQLFYRPGGDPEFSQVEMTGQENQFSAAIPKEAVTSRGVAYYLTFEDWLGRRTRHPESGVLSIPVIIPEPGVQHRVPTPAGRGQAAYRLVSVPIDLELQDADAVLVDDLGDYDVTRWRFFELRFDGTLAEFPGTETMTPGKAFWLIDAEGGRRLDTGPGVSNGLHRPFRIPLHPGWNLVGNPFHFPVPIENVRTESGQELALRAFEGSWNDPLNDAVARMQPFAGYAVFNARQAVDALLIDPDVRTSAGKTREAKGLAATTDWALRLVARAPGALDADNVAAVAPGAVDGWDPADQPEPPVVGGFVSAAFLHPEWGRPTDRYSTDVRSAGAEGYIWPLEVRTDLDGMIDLHVEGLDELPTGMSAWLVDELLGHTQELHASPRYAFAADPERTRPLKLVVGTSSFLAGQLQDRQQVPENFDLLPGFPNPFRTTTTIQYALPAAASVSLKVYNVLGEEVAVLVDGAHQEAGRHVQVWNGRSTRGESLTSGTYFVRLETDHRVRTRPVVLVR